jgi:VWFA-related protein
MLFQKYLPAVLLLSCATNMVSPQEANKPSHKEANAPTLKVQTRLVMVDVVARDKSGKVVTDLQPEDFKLLEDGKPQRISVFAFQHPGTEPAAAEPKPASIPNTFNNKPRFRGASSLNVILVDALNTTFLNQAYVRVEMVKFLEKLPPGQPIAIYTMGRKLRLLQDFTTDLDQLKRVIQSMKGESSHVLSDANGTSEAPMTLTGIADQVAIDMATQLRAQIQDFSDQNIADRADERVQYTMGALMSLARTLAGFPGRKNLIWLSESVPLGIYPDARPVKESNDTRAQLGEESAPGTRNGIGNQRDYVNQLRLLSNMLADAEVSVYPVDARGLVGSAFFNVANPMNGQGGAGGLATKIEGKQAEELFQAHYNMRDIAENTGGLPFYNRNDLDVAVREGINDGSTYYSIGYYPTEKTWDGKFRKIQLTVTRAGVKLRHRAGYYAIDRAEFERHHPEQRKFDMAVALNPDYPTAMGLQFQASITPPVRGETKTIINYAIDATHISFLEAGQDGLQHAQVSCAARVFLPKDVEHPKKTEAYRVLPAIKPEVVEQIRKTYFPCRLELELPPGHYLLRLLVRDDTTGLMGTANAEVTVANGESVAAESEKH